ncbi:MAG: zinc-ribbon domain-containing protein [Desulfobacterales bacterium]|nr:zinc-ribbon domain-containing protein [Desulfobacterales bacterium]
MNVVCDNCQSKFTIPDDKIPSGKTVTLKCTKCESRITVTGPPAPSSDATAVMDSDISNTEESPFGYMEEGVETALICESDPSIKSQIKAALAEMGYRMTEAADARSALRNMRYHEYDVVVVNELFGTNDPGANGVLIYLERQLMSVRRNIFVTLLSRRFQTMDQMMAFNNSVDLILNIDNIGEFGKILTRALKEKKAFYRVFRETMKKIGRY